MIKIANKLVRDKIPEIIEGKGGSVSCRTLSQEEFRSELIKKMNEETAEFDKDNTLEELGDMYAVMSALAQNAGYSMEDVMHVSEQKQVKNGGFSKRIFMEYYNEHGVLR